MSTFVGHSGEMSQSPAPYTSNQTPLGELKNLAPTLSMGCAHHWCLALCRTLQTLCQGSATFFEHKNFKEWSVDPNHFVCQLSKSRLGGVLECYPWMPNEDGPVASGPFRPSKWFKTLLLKHKFTMWMWTNWSCHLKGHWTSITPITLCMIP